MINFVCFQIFFIKLILGFLMDLFPREILHHVRFRWPGFEGDERLFGNWIPHHGRVFEDIDLLKVFKPQCVQLVVKKLDKFGVIHHRSF